MRKRWMLAVILTAIASVGCARRDASSPPRLTSAVVSTSRVPDAGVGPIEAGKTSEAEVAPEGEEVEEAAPSGVLVVGGAIVAKCPELRALEQPLPEDENDSEVWFAILEAVASCMGEAPLASEHILVFSEPHPAALVRMALSELGIDESRIETIEIPSEENPCTRERCEFFAVRIELDPRPPKVPHGVTDSPH